MWLKFGNNMMGFFMRKTSIAVVTAFIALAAFTAPVSAATIVSDNGGDLAEVIHSNGSQSGTSLTLQSNPSNYLINYTSSDSLFVTGNGVAQVFGTSGGFSDVSIVPLSNISFSAFKFNLNIPSGPTGGAKNDFTFDAQVFFTGGGSQLFDNVDLGAGNGVNRFLISAGSGQLMDKIILSDLELSSTIGDVTNFSTQDFTTIEQASFNFASAVPEPSTWAEFVVGFGLIGMMLRRRRILSPAV